MDRDFILYCRYKDAERSHAYASRSGDELFLQLDILIGDRVPGEGSSSRIHPADLDQEVFFLLDCSGSMEGDSIREAKSALEISLRALPEGSYFNIVRFGSQYESLYRAARELNTSTFEEARTYLTRADADLGGTELFAPLEYILNAPLKRTRRAILLITDGEVGNEEEIIGLMDSHKTSARLFTLGIGAGPDEYLVKTVARTGGGSYEFIFPGERIEPKVLRIFQKMLSNQVIEPSIKWGKAAVQAPDSLIFFQGHPTTVFARLANGDCPDKISVHGRISGKPITWDVEVTTCDGQEMPIRLLWAKERIRDLEGGIALADARHHDRKQSKNLGQLKHELISLSRTYGLVSRETDYVAIEERAEDKRTKGEIEVRKVPALVTRGWQGYGSVNRLCCLSERRLSKIFHVDVDYEAEDLYKPLVSEPEGVVFMLLKTQRVSGGFLLDELTAAQLGLNYTEMEKIAGTIITSGKVDQLLLLSTAVILHVLETRYAESRSMWEGVVKKSRDWLERQIEKNHPVIEGQPLRDWVVEYLNCRGRAASY
jgi:Ca-activated chloride channel family protein